MRPFVSRDGQDNQGVRAEVHVQVGNGTIDRIENHDNDRANACIYIKSDIGSLKHAIKGWVSKKDPIYPMILAAKDEGRTVSYRIEAQRKKGVDRTTPIADLRPNLDVARENTMTLFVGIDANLSAEAVTDPAEDPAPGGRVSAIGQNRASKAEATSAAAAAGPVFNVEQALTALATARQAGLGDDVVAAATALALMAGATAKQVREAGLTEQGRAAVREARRAHAAEAPPHVQVNTDGRTNLGSYQVMGAFSAEQVARDILSVAFEGKEMQKGQDLAVAKMLLDLADRVQVSAYGGGRPDRMANSHTRARSLVFDLVTGPHPMPFGAEPEVRTTWMTAVVDECVERFQALAAIAADITFTGEVAQAAEPTEAQTEPAPEQATASRPERTEAKPAAQPRPKAPVEGDEGFIAPTAEVIKRFGALAEAAGFEATPQSPVIGYLHTKFGVSLARKVHGESLDALVGWFERQGDKAAGKFREQVLRTVGQEESADAPTDVASDAA